MPRKTSKDEPELLSLLLQADNSSFGLVVSCSDVTKLKQRLRYIATKSQDAFASKFIFKPHPFHPGTKLLIIKEESYNGEA